MGGGGGCEGGVGRGGALCLSACVSMTVFEVGGGGGGW